MLKETKLALRISTTAYDAEIARLIKAGAADLGMVGVECSGISFTISAQGAVTDNSTITDERLIEYLITYVRVHFGSPADYDRLKASMDEQKAQLMSCSGYGLPEDTDNAES